MKRLFLDDIRNPIDCLIYMDNPVYHEEWDIVRNYDDFVKYITENGIPDEISFDHDLGDDTVGTGYDVARYIEERCFNFGCECPVWNVHSANPVGRKNIEAAMMAAEKYSKEKY